MKKAILFIWFGNEKPPYIQWTLDNFRKMNPGWDIRFIEYSNEQIADYKSMNDDLLAQVVEHLPQTSKSTSRYNVLADNYRSKYLQAHKDELVVYCDLDCFPIAPFDKFVCYDNDNAGNWIKSTFCPNRHMIFNLGRCTARFNSKLMFKGDIWCMSNNTMITFEKFIQIHKGAITDDTLTLHEGMFINQNNFKEFDKRRNDFVNMKIELGDNFCLPQFTPIEHYYAKERSKLNKE